ncbi:Na+/H+ exchanger [Carpediemonas membranifera]|uniref:Sodium/hydrogen exchanger n=1 Tax=Carpediemonas membranifera TaxID=201153 RepID=A0A8J6AYP7_9EUKA|nr:Na+/H+ exchanger [Carpediemonas membranifera]|eukprot:KAG9394680.1 Na+/H+ exchanger [Carpediemonas membranifera]
MSLETDVLVVVLLLFFVVLGLSLFHCAGIHALPESSIAIVIGMIVGVFVELFLSTSSSLYSFLVFDTDVFFYILLPPILLDSGYLLNKTQLFRNFGTIMLYAIVGTILNAFFTAASVWAAPQLFGGSIEPSFVEAVTFGALISAVDPVAVLAIFEETQVNDFLSILVSGESLMNDAASIVLFQGFRALVGETVTFWSIVWLVLKFFIVVVASTIIGFLFAALGSLITKYLTRKVSVAETLVMFLTSLLAYVICDILTLSGVIGILTASIAHSHYTDRNLSGRSLTSARYIFRALAMIAETIIFVQLGIAFFTENVWLVNWLQLIWVYLTISVSRLMFTILLSWLSNLFRPPSEQISWRDEFVLTYGGLRGAIAFGLAIDFPEEDEELRTAVIRITLLIVLITVFLQGSTMKYVLKLLEISLRDRRAAEQEDSLPVQTLMAAVPQVVSGIYVISGHGSLLHNLAKWDARFIVPVLTRVPIVHGEALIMAFDRDLHTTAATAGARLGVSPAVASSGSSTLRRPLQFGYRTSEALGVDTEPRVYAGSPSEYVPASPAMGSTDEPTSSDSEAGERHHIPTTPPSTPPDTEHLEPPEEEEHAPEAESPPLMDLGLALRGPRYLRPRRLEATPAITRRRPSR